MNPDQNHQNHLVLMKRSSTQITYGASFTGTEHNVAVVSKELSLKWSLHTKGKLICSSSACKVILEDELIGKDAVFLFQ